MDKIPTPAGGAPDGAFERFLTAALATIITIMFSWRLLAEEEEANGATGSGFSSQPSFEMPVNPMKYNTTPLKNKMSSANVHDVDIDLKLAENGSALNLGLADDQIECEDVVYDRHDPVQEQSLEAMPSADESMSSGQDDSLTVDTLTTWDEYKWEEEMGEEDTHVIKTRRNVRDFISDTNKSLNLSLNNEHVNTDMIEPQPVSVEQNALNSLDDSNNPSVPFSQRFANFEYKDAGGDSGYIDLYPDVESDDTDSSDDEQVYEIQVSDSESEDERGGAFFGVTALDTIMEEFESDISDQEDASEDRHHRDDGLGDGGLMGEVIKAASLNIDDNVVINDNIHAKPCDTICDRDTEEDQINYKTSSNVHSSIDVQNMSTVLNEPNFEGRVSSDDENDQISELGSLQNKIDINAKRQPQLKETVFASTEANNVECNLSLDKLLTVNTQQTSPDTCFNEQTRDEECDLHLNEVNTDNKSEINYETLNIAQSEIADTMNIVTNTDLDSGDKTMHESNKPSILNLNDDDYKISEISDDSLPSSPIRTCALDNLTEEPFSDTESCSSESVITVLSVKSNESENYTDRSNDKIQNPISFSPAIADVTAAGRRDLSTHISDSSDGLNSKYDNYSLVSGFLNDSLNSLLSANTGSNENLSETESSSINENLETKSDNQSDTDKMNGKLASDDSCVSSAESLPAVTDAVQSNAVISENGHIDSNDSLNIPNEQIDIEQNECNDYRSDSSSDSSDPPLREYDPDDDDLAEFQFDMGDDDDNDSFYLIIGDHQQERSNIYDDGALRNFDTFTNLNSIGLSPEYGDAVTSHTLSDDASGFKFAHTEEISTHFKKRSYITDRSNLSDSDGRSEGPLSPISSEDEENKSVECNENQMNMPVDSVSHAKSSNLPSHSAYQDAGLSIAQPPSVNEDKNESSQPTKAIDFKKYIIQNDTNTKTESVPHPVYGSRQMSDDQVDESSIKHNRMECVIDNQGDKIVSSGDNKLNNLHGTIDTEETLSSLTEKIQLLSHSPQPVAEDKLSDTEQDSLSENRSGSTGDIDEIAFDVHTDVRSTGNAEPVYSGKAIETDIDADYENGSETNVVIGSRTNSKIETNIDDIFNDLTNSERENVSPKRHVVDVIPTKSRFEINIDDIFEENTHFLHANKAVETDIDEVLNATEFKPSQSTPFKNDLTTKRETNIDDVIGIGIEPHIQVREHIKHTSQTKRETSVDDLFESPLDSDSAKHEDISLSYDSFVDNLHESVPRESSHRNGTDITSESAIPLEKSNEPPLLSSPSSSLLTTHNKVITPGGVQPDNVHEELELKQNIDCVLNVNANLQEVTEPSEVDGIHNQIVNQDYIDDNDVDKIESITNDNIHTTIQTVQNIGTNYRKISKEQTEIPVICDQNNEDIDDNGITCETNVAICDLKDRENLNDISESVTTLSSLNNSATDNREQLLSNLNTRPLIHTDYNANISLPKVEILNHNTHVGRSPETDNKYIEHKVGIPVVTEHQPCTQLNTTDIDSTADRDGEQLFDNLLKLEDESHVNDIELKIIEEDDSSVKSDSVHCTDENLDSIGSCSLDLISDDESLNSIEESFNSLQDSYNAGRRRGLSDSELTARIVRAPATKPSDLLGRSKEVKGVKKKILRHQLKKYSSVLQRPVTPEKVHVVIETPHNPPSLSRIKVLKSREKFLSAENISERSFEDKFLKHRTSFTSSTPRKYLKRNEKSFQKSTESLPADMGDWNACYGSNASVEYLHSLPSPRQIEELFQSRYSSANSSFERGEYDKLHANCIFSASKREEIRHTTQSLENMFDQLLRYGSISSLATETDLDAEIESDQNSNDTYYLFQYPLERAASMSAIVESRDTHHRLPRKPGKGRFASRNVPKSKSLQTLETNLDDVFTDECEPGELKKAPSEHELRVSKSLSKLNVPDWFRKSSFSRSDSTQSLFTYARTSSTSTIGSAAYPSLASSPSPSVTPGSNAVIIQKRVTPNTTIPPSTRLLRAPMLPTTPERAPIHNTPPVTGLPSDKFRKQEKKELKPIAIVPFAKLREMFERKAQDDAKTKEAATSPTKEKPSAKVRFEPPSPTKETVIDDRLNGHNPVQNDNSERTKSPPPPLPERKPILSHSVKNSESAPQPRRTQVHFSDEPKVSTRSQEQNSNTIRENGAAPSTSSSKPKKPQGLRASLPMPQFRFRRPGSFAKQNAAAVQSSSSQSKKETTV